MPSTDVANRYAADVFGDALARQLCEKVVEMVDEDATTWQPPNGALPCDQTEMGLARGQDKPRPGTKIGDSKIGDSSKARHGSNGSNKPPTQPPLPVDLLGNAQQPARRTDHASGVSTYGMEDVYRNEPAPQPYGMPHAHANPHGYYANYAPGYGAPCQQAPYPAMGRGLMDVYPQQAPDGACMGNNWDANGAMGGRMTSMPQEYHHHAEPAGASQWLAQPRMPDQPPHGMMHPQQMHHQQQPQPMHHQQPMHPQQMPHPQQMHPQQMQGPPMHHHQQQHMQQQQQMQQQMQQQPQQQGGVLPAKLALINGQQLAAVLDTANPTLLQQWGQTGMDQRGDMQQQQQQQQQQHHHHQHNQGMREDYHDNNGGYMSNLPPGLGSNHRQHQQHVDELELDDYEEQDRRSHSQLSRAMARGGREAETRRCSCSFIFIGFDPVQHADFELVPRLIGRGGAHMRDIAEVCRGKVRIRGRGSGYKEVRKGRRPPAEADVPLQIALSCEERSSLEQGKARLLAFLEHLSGHFQRYCRKQGLAVPPALYVLVGDE